MARRKYRPINILDSENVFSDTVTPMELRNLKQRFNIVKVFNSSKKVVADNYKTMDATVREIQDALMELRSN